MLNPNIIGAIQTIAIAQVENLPVVLDEKQPVIDEQHPIQIIDVSGLIIELEDKASLTQLESETTQRVNADTDLQTQINLKLAEANSIFRAEYTKYVVDGRDNIQSVIDSITNEGTIVFLSSGSIGGSGLVINKQNIALIAPKSTPSIVEILQPTTTAITADRLRFSNIQFDGEFIGGSSRSVYTECDFMQSVNIVASATAGYMTFNKCEFVAGKEINVANNFASVIFFIDCNFSGAVFSLNQFSNQQVIFSNCGGFVSFPTNAFYAGINTLTSGYIQNTITKTILTAGSGTSGQVYTSGGAGGIDTWSTPSSGGSSPIKESFTRYTQGQVVSTSKGNITLPNITTQQNVTANSLTWTELLGSSINYTPPTGSNFVEYEVDFNCFTFTPSVAQETFFSLALYIDNVEQKITRQRIILAGVPSGPGEKNYKFKTVISITGTTDPNKVSLNSWNTSRNMKIMLLKEQNNRDLTINFLSELFVGGGDPVQTTIIPPLLKITAY